MDVVNVFVEPLKEILPHLPGAILNLVIGIVLINIIMFVIRRFMRLVKVPHDFRGLIISITKFILWLVLTIFVVSSLGFGNLAVVLSGSAIVLVFFLNNSIGPLLNNLVSGFFLLSDPDFQVGMKVIANDGKTTGKVHGIDMRKVRIIDEKGKMHIVPNAAVENSEWIIIARKEK